MLCLFILSKFAFDLYHFMRLLKFGIFLICSFAFLNAQLFIHGVIKNTNKQGVGGIYVYSDRGNWTISDSKGNFSIEANQSSTTTLYFDYANIQQKKVLVSNYKDFLNIEIKSQTIFLDDIVVTAKNNKFSSIVLQDETLKNQQVFSLEDILNQLPGQQIKPFDINSYKNIVFRTASGEGLNTAISNEDSYGNKAFGVGYFVNGVSVNNNLNMQSYQPNVHGPFEQGFASFDISSNHFSVDDPRRNIRTNNANYGMDLRKLPLGNIKKIEVIQGVPSVKYGDFNSGLVLIETQAGEKKWEADFSVHSDVLQASLSKGFKYSGNKAINFGITYLNSNLDPRDQLISYKRLSSDLLWTWTNNEFIVNNFSLNFSQNLDTGQTDKENINQLFVKNTSNQLRLSNQSKINYKSILTNSLEATVGLSLERQNSLRTSFENTGALPYSSATESGVYYGKYTPVNFTMRNEIKGFPVSFYTNLSASKTIKFHKLLYGLNFKWGKNFGEGRKGNQRQFLFDSSTPLDGFREYNFRENAQSLMLFSAFLEDDFKKNMEIGKLNINLGLRYDAQNHNHMLSPRFNMALKRNRFTYRIGTGLLSKSPSLNMMYAGKKYLDLLIGDYRLPGFYSTAIVQTIVSEGDTPNIKTAKSWKSEIGLDYNYGDNSLSITAYYNYLYDGFAAKPIINQKQISDVKVNLNGNQPPTFSIIGDKLYHFLSYQNTNGLQSKDIGIEMLFKAKKIEILKLTPSLRFAWTYTKNSSDIQQIEKAKKFTSRYLYGVYASENDESSNVLLAANFSFHFPKLGLLINLSTEHFLKNNIYKKDSYKYPIAYINKDFEQIEIPENEVHSDYYLGLLRGAKDGYNQNLNRLLHNFHLRISKEFLNGFKVSLYAQNMLNLKPIYYSELRKKQLPYRNFTPFSFGTSVNFKF